MKTILYVSMILSAMPLPAQESVERLDAKLDTIIAPDAVVETLCQGFQWSEGPVWDKKEQRLLFSDVPRNTIYEWREGMKEAQVFMKPSGFTGVSPYGREAGSNGLAIDAKGQLLLCEHGDRRVAYLTPEGGKRTLTDHYQGKRFNSPNDLAIARNGTVYFTDPPYGLPSKDQEKFRELDFHGVYRVGSDGVAYLLTKELDRPNGLALSPDETILYVAQSHGPKPVIMAYPIKENGDIGEGKVFFDTKGLSGPGAPDGIKVNAQGIVFSTGPGGVLILDDQGKLLGRIICGRATANVAFGPDEKSLFITSKDRLLRIKLR
jgi:gluconolactonase